jgi:hypothetical protein
LVNFQWKMTTNLVTETWSDWPKSIWLPK